MTAQEFILQLDEVAPQLTECGFRLIVRLMALSIRTGSRSIIASDRWLCTDLKMSRNGITAAKGQLVNLLGVDIRDRSATCYTLPADIAVQVTADMFSTSGSIFDPELDRKPDQTGSETSPALDWKSLQTGPIFRADWIGNQSRLDRNPIQLDRRSVQTGSKIDPVATENQQVRVPNSDVESSRSLSVPEDNGIDLDRVASAKVVEPSLRSDASELQDHLYWYMQSTGPADRDRAMPDDEVLAKCLAIAPLCDLKTCLERLKGLGRNAGSNYAWFWSTFLDKIHQIPAGVWKRHHALYKFREAGKVKSGKDFAADVLNQASRNQRRTA